MIPLDENRIDQMCLILDQAQRYTPTIVTDEKVVLPNGEDYFFKKENMHEILIGGDQVTVTRARSSIAVRRTHDTNKEKLLGVVPVIEDWHARLILMQVSCIYQACCMCSSFIHCTNNNTTPPLKDTSDIRTPFC